MSFSLLIPRGLAQGIVFLKLCLVYVEQLIWDEVRLIPGKMQALLPSTKSFIAIISRAEVANQPFAPFSLLLVKLCYFLHSLESNLKYMFY